MELQLIDDEDSSSDFSVAIDAVYITDSEVYENDALQSSSYKVVGDNIDKNIRASFQ